MEENIEGWIEQKLEGLVDDFYRYHFKDKEGKYVILLSWSCTWMAYDVEMFNGYVRLKFKVKKEELEKAKLMAFEYYLTIKNLRDNQ